MKKRILRQCLSAVLAGATLMIGCLPAAATVDEAASTKLHLTMPADSQQSADYIQSLFNTSVLGYGAADSSNTTSNVEGPNKLWDGETVASTTDYYQNGNLQIVSAESVGGESYLEDSGVLQFYLHDREDYDSTGERYDRQRIEIKSHDKISDSAPALAVEDDIYTYRWKFKLPENCYTPISNNRDEQLANFFHIFQLKAIKGSENSMPIATFSIEDGYLMFQHIAISGRGMGYNTIIGDKIPLSDIEGKWLSAEVTVLYRDEGYIHVTLDDLESGTELINDGAQVDTWRRPELGEGSMTYESDYPAITSQGVRCKWGLYRKYIPDAYRLDPSAGGNSEINLSTLPSWWKDATMWLGDLEVVKEDRSHYQFPDRYNVGDYQLPQEGEDLIQRTAPSDGGVDYARQAEVKVCSYQGSSHMGNAMLDGVSTTTWDTAKDMLNTDSNTVYWAALDLGEVRSINKFMLQFNTTSNKLSSYQLYWAGEEGADAYAALKEGETADPLELAQAGVWKTVEGVGYHPGVNKYVKAYQMDIFDAAAGRFEALNGVRYLLLRGDVVHDGSQKSIKTALFKAINTEEQPEIQADVVMGENVALNCAVKTSTSSELKDGTGSSYDPKRYTSEYLTDGDDSTVWATHSSQVTAAADGAKYWAAIDLGQQQTLSMFRIQWGSVSNRVTSYQVFYSNDASDYSNLTEGISKAANATPDPTALEGNHWLPATEYLQKTVASNSECTLLTQAPISAQYLLLLCDVDATQKAGAINTASFDAGLAEEIPVQVVGYADTLGTIRMLPGLEKGEIISALLPQRFSVRLSNGADYALAVQWDTDDIDALQPDEPGTYTIAGTLQIPDNVSLDFSQIDTSIARTIVIEEDVWAEDTPTVTPDDGGSSHSSSRFLITAQAGEGGSISPDGKVTVTSGSRQHFTITANEGYRIADVLVDGKSVGALSSYIFEKTNANHTITALFQVDDSLAGPQQTGVSKLLETDLHIAYLAGYPDGNFGPTDCLTRAQAAQLFYNLLRDKNVSAPVQFSDVNSNAWYAQAVNTLAALGILDGVGNNQFAPERPITRAEFAVIAIRFTQTDAAINGATPFSDITENDWFYASVQSAAQYGWINGYTDGTFRPQNLVTRSEVTAVVNRMLDRSADQTYVDRSTDTLLLFPDVPASNWAYYDICEATNAHSYKQTDGVEHWNGLTES